MKARFKRGWLRTYGTLTPGNVYRVIGIEAGALRIFDDLGDPVLFVPQAFDIVESSEPIGWSRMHGNEGELYAYPAELAERGFFERWHDGDAGARERLARYMRDVCWREANAVEESGNTYLRVQRKHAENDSPTLLYRELDEERWEVRKIEVFADGRMTCADARSQSGDSRLGEVAVPPLDQMAVDPQFEAVVISRTEFERLWDKAACADEDAGDRPR